MPLKRCGGLHSHRQQFKLTFTHFRMRSLLWVCMLSPGSSVSSHQVSDFKLISGVNLSVNPTVNWTQLGKAWIPPQTWVNLALRKINRLTLFFSVRDQNNIHCICLTVFTLGILQNNNITCNYGTFKYHLGRSIISVFPLQQQLWLV